MPLQPRLALAVLVAVMTGACTTGRPELSPARAAHPVRHVLPNGVRIIVEEHRRSDVAAVQLWVQAGGRDEAPGEDGLAHYLEHMLFKGTAVRPARAIDHEVEGSGGRLNAGTSLDYTYYHLLLPAERAAAAIEMLADISVNATLDERVLDAEKRVVLEEMRLREDQQMPFLRRKVYEVVFAGHPYGRPVIGTPGAIGAVTREQLLAFYRRLYVPENFTLVVVGAVDPQRIVAAAARAFGRLPRSGMARLPAPAPPALQPRAVALTRHGAHAYLALAWQGPRLGHADTAAVDLLVSILGQARSSRLVQGLRERLGVVNAVTSTFTPLEAAGLITVTAQLAPGDVPRAEREMLAEIRRIQSEGVTEAERQRAVTAVEAEREFLAETAEGRARLLGRAVTVWRLEDELLYLDRVRSVTGEQIRAAARRYLDPEHYVRVTVTPGEGR